MPGEREHRREYRPEDREEIDQVHCGGDAVPIGHCTQESHADSPRTDSYNFV